jgi:hypothetical protein
MPPHRSGRWPTAGTLLSPFGTGRSRRCGVVRVMTRPTAISLGSCGAGWLSGPVRLVGGPHNPGSDAHPSAKIPEACENPHDSASRHPSEVELSTGSLPLAHFAVSCWDDAYPEAMGSPEPTRDARRPHSSRRERRDDPYAGVGRRLAPAPSGRLREGDSLDGFSPRPTPPEGVRGAVSQSRSGAQSSNGCRCLGPPRPRVRGLVGWPTDGNPSHR